MTTSEQAAELFAASASGRMGYWPEPRPCPHAAVVGAPMIGGKTIAVKASVSDNCCAGLQIFTGSLRVRLCGVLAQGWGVRFAMPPNHSAGHRCGSLSWL